MRWKGCCNTANCGCGRYSTNPTLDGPYFEETLYVTPTRLLQAKQDEIAARAIGRMLRHALGMSLEELILRHALDRPLPRTQHGEASGPA